MADTTLQDAWQNTDEQDMCDILEPYVTAKAGKAAALTCDPGYFLDDLKNAGLMAGLILLRDVPVKFPVPKNIIEAVGEAIDVELRDIIVQSGRFLPLPETMPSSSASPEIIVLAKECREAFNSLFLTLDKHEAEILKHRYYEGRTMEETATLMPYDDKARFRKERGHIGHQRVLEMEKHALRKLRHPSRAQNIRSFYYDL